MPAPTSTPIVFVVDDDESVREAPARLVRAHRAAVEVRGELAQPRIERAHALELLVADAREQPALGDLHADFGLRVVCALLKWPTSPPAIVISDAVRDCVGASIRAVVRLSRCPPVTPDVWISHPCGVALGATGRAQLVCSSSSLSQPYLQHVRSGLSARMQRSP